MSKQREPYWHFRLGVLVMAIVYLLITTAHLFFAPQFEGDTAIGDNHISKNNSQLIYNLIRTNRCTVDGKKTLQPVAKVLSAKLIAHLKPTLSPANKLVYNNLFLPDHHFVWLSNRILRI